MAVSRLTSAKNLEERKQTRLIDNLSISKFSNRLCSSKKITITCNSNSIRLIFYSHLEQRHPACTPRSSIRLPRCSMISSQTPHFPARELRGGRTNYARVSRCNKSCAEPSAHHRDFFFFFFSARPRPIDPTSHRESPPTCFTI